jgi:hypothetical protein
VPTAVLTYNNGLPLKSNSSSTFLCSAIFSSNGFAAPRKTLDFFQKPRKRTLKSTQPECSAFTQTDSLPVAVQTVDVCQQTDDTPKAQKPSVREKELAEQVNDLQRQLNETRQLERDVKSEMETIKSALAKAMKTMQR